MSLKCSSLPRPKTLCLLIAFSIGLLIFYFAFYDELIPTAELLRELPRDHPYVPLFLRHENSSHKLNRWARTFLQKTRRIALTKSEEALFHDILMKFDRIWRQKMGRIYMIIAGTLLGAYRHGRMTPFDDDIDVVVDMKYEKNFSRVFAFGPLACSNDGPFRKVWSRDSKIAENGSYNWPFIDVFFYRLQSNGQEVFMRSVGTFPTRHIFPAISMPFMGRWFLAPRCPKAYLQRAHGGGIPLISIHLTLCCTYNYSHRFNKKFGNDYCILCSLLRDVFQFADWRRINASHVQQLLSIPPSGNSLGPTVQKGPIMKMPQC